MLWLEIQEALFQKGKYKIIQSHNHLNYRINNNLLNKIFFNLWYAIQYVKRYPQARNV